MPRTVNVTIEYSCVSLQEFFHRYSRDLSAKGIFVRTTEIPEVTAPLRFKFLLNNGGVFLVGEGNVAWARKEVRSGAAAGFTVSFSKLSPFSESLLERMLEYKQAKIQLVDSPSLDDELDAIGDEAARVFLEDALEIKALPIALAPVASDSADWSSAAGTIDMVSSAGAEEMSMVAQRLLTEKQKSAGRGQGSRGVLRGLGQWGWWIMALLILAIVGGLWIFSPPLSHVTSRPSISRTARAASTDKAATGSSSRAVIAREMVQLRVDSSPPGALISVNGKSTGKNTPAELDHLDAELALELLLDLKGQKLHRVRVRPGEKREYIAKLRPARRKVLLSTAPQGAQAFLNGFYIGTTPLEIKRVLKPRATYWIRVEADGYKTKAIKILGKELPWQRQGEDEVSRISLSLEKQGNH